MTEKLRCIIDYECEEIDQSIRLMAAVSEALQSVQMSGLRIVSLTIELIDTDGGSLSPDE